MADDTPTRSTRFPSGLDDRFVEYRDGRDMTNSEALRSLVRTGLEHEQGVAADGGEVLARVDELHERQRREERREAYENALVGLAVLVGVALLAGYSAPLTLGLGAFLGAALIVTAIRPLVAGGSDDD